MSINVATIWLDGCSGCHMSFLDMDERLIELAEKINIVYSPYVDTKEFPQGVDLTIVEGAVSTTHDLEMIRIIRERSGKILALGDCAVTGNVSAMKNLFGTEAVLQRGYFEHVDINEKNAAPNQVVPELLDTVLPLNEVVAVDYFVPGCPTPADAIYGVLTAILEGREPKINELTRFGK